MGGYTAAGADVNLRLLQQNSTDCILGSQQSRAEKGREEQSGAGRNGVGVGRADGWGPGEHAAGQDR